MKFNDLEKAMKLFNEEGLSVEDLDNAYIDLGLEKEKMQVDIILEQQGDSICTVTSSEQAGMCWLEIKEGNQSVGALVSIEDLKLALRKLTVR